MLQGLAGAHSFCIYHALSNQPWKKGWKTFSADMNLDRCGDRPEDSSRESLDPMLGIVLTLSVLVMRKLIMKFSAKDFHPGLRLCSLRGGRIVSFKAGLGASLGFIEHDLSPFEEPVFNAGATVSAPKLSKNKHAQVEFIFAKAPT
jgi:hypothetical protein